jgi:hypothetical protein
VNLLVVGCGPLSVGARDFHGCVGPSIFLVLGGSGVNVTASGVPRVLAARRRNRRRPSVIFPSARVHTACARPTNPCLLGVFDVS